MRLAYLCNLYPAVSHSFVRREIEGVERGGHEVYRFSLRPARADLKDEADLREAKLTETILAQGVGNLFLAAIALSLSTPGKTLSAAKMARKLSAPGVASKARHFAYWLEAAWLVRRLRRLHVEHVHAHFGTNPAAVATIARAWGGPPFSFTVHGSEFDRPAMLALPAKIAAASFVAAISNYGRAQLMRWSNPDHWDKIKIIRCGLDRAFLEAPVRPVQRKSREFVCVARLAAEKGLPLLIAACDQLRKAGERFSLTIVGDGELRENLQSDICRRGLQDYVSLAGIQSSSEIRDHLHRARAFVLPSFAEGLPVVIMEALALSRPVIATAITGIPDLVDNECGWLIPPGSDHALVEAMRAALRASPDTLATKGAVGRERVRRMHDADANANLIIQAIVRESGFICTR